MVFDANVDFPGGSGQESTCEAGDSGSIPGSGRSPGGGHGTPLQYPCLENSMDIGAWRAVVDGVTKSRTQLNNGAHTWLAIYLLSVSPHCNGSFKKASVYLS